MHAKPAYYMHWNGQDSKRKQRLFQELPSYHPQVLYLLEAFEDSVAYSDPLWPTPRVRGLATEKIICPFTVQYVIPMPVSSAVSGSFFLAYFPDILECGREREYSHTPLSPMMSSLACSERMLFHGGYFWML